MMNYRKRELILTFVALILVGLLISGCERKSAETGNTLALAPSETEVPANTSDPATADIKEYSLASPSDAYRTAFEARKKCDKPVLKRVMSQAMIEAYTNLGQQEPNGGKTLDEMIQMLCDQPQAPNGDIKDEKTVGDEGTLKFQTETGKWQLMDFVRENGEWKLTLPRGRNELPALK